MILKLGYTDIDGINTFRYVENFTELRITPFIKEVYRYHLKENIVIFNNKHEILQTDILFNPEILKNNKVDYINVTYIYYLDKTTGSHVSIACLSDSVFIMNENGKTIDKY